MRGKEGRWKRRRRTYQDEPEGRRDGGELGIGLALLREVHPGGEEDESDDHEEYQQTEFLDGGAERLPQYLETDGMSVGNRIRRKEAAPAELEYSEDPNQSENSEHGERHRRTRLAGIRPGFSGFWNTRDLPNEVDEKRGDGDKVDDVEEGGEEGILGGAADEPKEEF